MEGFRIEESQSGTFIKPVARNIYETVKSGTWKTRNVSPNASTKGAGNKCRIYTSTYAPGAYRNTKS